MLSRTTVLFLAGLILGFGGVPSAWAENATARRPAGRLGRPDPGNPPPAPVGHRQPQAKDVAPADIPPADQATRELDKALEKKLTICRGC